MLLGLISLITLYPGCGTGGNLNLGSSDEHGDDPLSETQINGHPVGASDPGTAPLDVYSSAIQDEKGED